MLLGYTSGGSPIFHNVSSKKVSSKTLYSCSKDKRHRFTKNQARASNYMCTHCGEALGVKKQMIDKLDLFEAKYEIALATLTAIGNTETSGGGQASTMAWTAREALKKIKGMDK